MDNLSKQKIQDIARPIIYMNNPLDNEEEETLGYSSQLDELEDAITTEKAKVIGVLGTHGIGKSSIIGCLIKRLNETKREERTLQNQTVNSRVAQKCQDESKLIEINLWENSACGQNENTQPIAQITKSFLFQFALGLEK